MYHYPVLLSESVDGLNICPSGVYVDATFGGGGHSKEILSRLSDKGRLYSFDQDDDVQENSFDDSRFKLIRGNFRFIKNYLAYYGVEKVDGILADLGVSSHQFDVAERGFSYRLGGVLDMRMSPVQTLTAAQVLNTYEDSQLYYIFNNYCDIKNVGKLVKLILAYRESKEFSSIEEFIEAISPALPKLKDFKYLAQVFQVLRIEVNDEIAALNEFLTACPDLLRSGARLSVISYHSLEDRPVKNLIKTGNVEGKVETDIFGRSDKIFKQINRHVIVAGDEEVLGNPRAKSAKLRLAERI